MRSGKESVAWRPGLPMVFGRESRGPCLESMIRAMARRRGNPNWGRPAQPVPVLATEFEMQVHQLGLNNQAYADSRELRRWCERKRNRCYVPGWLLGVWEIRVDPTFS